MRDSIRGHLKALYDDPNKEGNTIITLPSRTLYALKRLDFELLQRVLMYRIETNMVAARDQSYSMLTGHTDGWLGEGDYSNYEIHLTNLSTALHGLATDAENLELIGMLIYEYE